MRKQLLGTFIVSVGLLATTSIQTKASAITTEPRKQPSVESFAPTTSQQSPALLFTKSVDANTVHPELAEQLRTRKGGTVKFWEAVAWCETNHNWNDGGYYSGGLGIAKSVWLNYGGRQFAPTPKTATKEEQIIVANRVVFFGFQTKNIFKSLEDRQQNRPYFRPAMGWRNMKNWGKGCVNWKTRKPARERYTEEGMAEWKKSRQSTKPVNVAGLGGSVSAQSVGNKTKRCVQWEKQLKAHGLVPVAKFSYIMWRESRCEPKAIGWNYKKGTSHRNCKLAPAEIYKKCKAIKSYDSGLLQVNSTWKTLTAQVCGGKYGDLAPLLTPECNLKVAKALYDDGGFGHWSATSGNNS